MSPEHVDVLIIGAGLSGIGAAAHLTSELPRTSYVVLEAREVSGGTWDLFRYPGVRSDSDMFTMGYAFRPWRREEALGSGERILEYLRDTAREYDVERHIRYSHRVVRMSWDSGTARWTVDAECDGR
jgi:cation diffusion facilitator CzcD-associated flavoprotein CzcO